MNIFSKKSTPKHVPPSGPITLTKAQFVNVMKTRPSGGEYLRLVGSKYGQTALENAFTESLRSMNTQNFWQYGYSQGVGQTNLRFQDNSSLEIFISTAMDSFFKFDLDKIKDRDRYAKNLKRDALNGSLFRELNTNTEPEANYYIAKAHTPPRPGAPAIPPKPKSLINLSKSIAWATTGLGGDKTSFAQTIIRYNKFGGPFPLGANITHLDRAFSTLVIGAPAYRGWNNTASQQKYPSNIGGKKLLDDIIIDLGRMPIPKQGDNLWYGLALYVFGSIIAVQAFTDGNKRMSRFAYVLMLNRGGVDFIAPTAKLGSKLGNMM